jgi:hypothetical protein
VNAWILVLTLVTIDGVSIRDIAFRTEKGCKDAAKEWLLRHKDDMPRTIRASAQCLGNPGPY